MLQVSSSVPETCPNPMNREEFSQAPKNKVPDGYFLTTTCLQNDKLGNLKWSRSLFVIARLNAMVLNLSFLPVR